MSAKISRAISVATPAHPLILLSLLISTIAIMMQPGALKAKEVTLKQTTIPSTTQLQQPRTSARLVQITTSDFKLSNLPASAFGDRDIEPDQTPGTND